MRCDKCKHWGAKNSAWNEGFRECMLFDDRGTHLAQTIESDWGSQALITKAEFGCVLFEVKNGLLLEEYLDG